MPVHHVRIPYLVKIDFEFRLPDGERGRISALADPDESYAFGPKIVRINLDATVVSDAVRMHIMESAEDA